MWQVFRIDAHKVLGSTKRPVQAAGSANAKAHQMSPQIPSLHSHLDFFPTNATTSGVSLVKGFIRITLPWKNAIMVNGIQVGWQLEKQTAQQDITEDFSAFKANAYFSSHTAFSYIKTTRFFYSFVRVVLAGLFSFHSSSSRMSKIKKYLLLRFFLYEHCNAIINENDWLNKHSKTNWLISRKSYNVQSFCWHVFEVIHPQCISMNCIYSFIHISNKHQVPEARWPVSMLYS